VVPSGQKFVERAAQCENVTGVGHLYVRRPLVAINYFQDLWRQIILVAADLAAYRELSTLTPFAAAKVGDFEQNLVSHVDQHIVRFNVAMDQILRVNVPHSFGHVNQRVAFTRHPAVVLAGNVIRQGSGAQF
jgi:hypothetical protein